MVSAFLALCKNLPGSIWSFLTNVAQFSEGLEAL